MGHRPIALVGGATGMIGDPSGRTSERVLLTPEMVERNVLGLKEQLARFVSFEGANAALVLNNYDWIAPVSHLEWLRMVGKHFTVNYMIAKESVRRRLEDREHGISYTEFSYMLLQAYDFLHLYDHHGCRVQAGGTDQWGNITAGTDLIRKVRGGEAYGLTLPLLSTASGEKFGKSAGNAVWLDAARTSPYQFYQFWMQTDDRDVERYLKLFTDESAETIAAVCAEPPEKREAQKLLAARMTEAVHGAAGLAEAARASEILFGKEFAGLTEAELGSIFADVPSAALAAADLGTVKLSQALVAAGACKSKGEAVRLIASGGVYVNNRRVTTDAALGPEDLATRRTLVLRTGKKNYFLVHFD
jgi:tyrosyl-tRNA synthetase